MRNALFLGFYLLVLGLVSLAYEAVFYLRLSASSPNSTAAARASLHRPLLAGMGLLVVGILLLWASQRHSPRRG